MVLLISYDLNRHERPSAYRAVEEVIRRNASDLRKPLYSQWLVETSESVSTWSERLRAAMDANDRLLVLRMQGATDGWLDKEIWAWLAART